ncbi:DUF6150 family protein [Pontibacter litorisediminis]|uniref:DUF6150 family protein n=1 Tax=Pontibacter litorisediminis TaxID=1846260 RepID=UPI0023EABF73|nr:DUF6150 family protein [Pontibacter litorisediminis]
MQILFTLWLALLPYVNAAPAAEAARNHCQVYGSVYLERNPLYKNTASHVVFLGEEEAFANMVVYRESNKLFADGPAVWYVTPNKAFADHVLYVTDQRHQADFTVHFTDVRSFATCRE